MAINGAVKKNAERLSERQEQCVKLKRGMGVTFYWDQKGTSKAISKAAAGLRVPYGASMPVACAAPSLRRSRGRARQGKAGSCLRVCDCDRRSLAPLPCSGCARWLIGAVPPACVCHSLPHESHNQMGTDGRGLSPPEWGCSVRPSSRPPGRTPPADSDPCLRGRTAALRGNSQLTRARCSGRTFRIGPSTHPPHGHGSPAAALLLAGGGRVRGKKNRLVGTTAKRILLFSVRAAQ